MKLFAGLSIVAAMFLGAAITANDDVKTADKQRIELGQVDWNRDLDEAKKKAAEKKRPIFLLFQEVPG